MANVIIVNTPGPQGQQGVAGLPGASASFDSISGSVVSTSSFNTFTSSYYETSGSISTRIQSLESFSSSLDATFATDTQLNAATASLSSSIASVNTTLVTVSSSFLSVSSSFLNVSSSFLSVSSSFVNVSSSFLSVSSSFVNVSSSFVPVSSSFVSVSSSFLSVSSSFLSLSSSFLSLSSSFIPVSSSFVNVSSSFLSLSSSFRSGSFSGSFNGNGSGLTNIPASGIVGLNLSQIATGSITASVSTSSGSFTVSSDSTNLLFISSSGNVGIGTTTPGFKLDVNGSISGTSLNANFAVVATRASKADFYGYTGPTLSYYNGVSIVPALTVIDTGNISIGVSSPTARLHIRGAGSTSSTTALLVQNANASSSLAVLDDGRVGIGTSNPTVQLDLVGSYKQTLVNGVLGLYHISTANANQVRGVWDFYTNTGVAPDFFGRFGFKFEGGTSDSFKQYQIYVADSIIPKMVVTGNGRIGLGTITPTASLHISGSSGAALLQVDSPASSSILFVSGSGNVGIGTNNPISPLHVVSTDGRGIRVTNVGGGQDALLITNASSLVRWSNGSYIGSSGLYTQTLDTQFQTFDGANVQTRLFIQASNGNVGIGTVTPIVKLDVSGSGRFTNGLTVANGLTITGSLITSGSATIYGNLSVIGTASFISVTSSGITVGTSVITLNTDSPAVRFGGLTVIDSGSFGNSSSGSLLWDSQRNHWIYSNPSGSTYNSGMFISGPRNSGSVGDEQGTTFNAFLKGQGGDHLTSSMMYEVSGNVGIGTSTPSTLLHVSGAGSLLKIDSPSASSILFVTGSGQVGINTSNPSQALTIESGSILLDNNYALKQKAANGSTLDMLTLNAANSLFIGSGQRDVYFRSGYNNVMYVTSSAVGIGTNSPQRVLHVDASGSTFTDTPLALTSVDANNRVGILFGSSSLATGKQHKLFHRVNGPTAEWLLSSNAGESGIWRFSPRDDNNYAVNIVAPYNGGTTYITTGLSQSLFSLGAGGQNNQHLNISSSGFVGIGTTAPAANLHVRLDQNATTQIRVENATNDANSRASLSIGSLGDSITVARYLSNYTGVTGWANKGAVLTDSSLTGGFFFRTAAGPIAFQPAGNTDRVVFAENGNVGIGTTSPTTSLHIYSTSSVRSETPSGNIRTGYEMASIYYGGVGAGTYFYPGGPSAGNNIFGEAASNLMQTNLFQMATGTMKIGTVGLGATQLYTNSLPRLTVTSTGEVGIGTTAPSASLHISGASSANLLRIDSPASSSILFVSGSGRIGIGTNNPTSSLHIVDTGISSINSLQLNNRFQFRGDGVLTYGSNLDKGRLTWNGSGTYFHALSGNGVGIGANGVLDHLFITTAGLVGIGTAGASSKLQVVGIGTTSATTALLVQNANASSSLVVLDDGNVGIGTSNPAGNLDVIGTGIFGNGSLRTSFTGTIKATNNAGTQTNLFLLQSGVGSAHFGFKSNDSALYIVNSYSTGNITDTSSIVLTNTGNVGIGTVSPTSKLHISGSSGSALLRIDSPATSSIMYVSGSGAIGFNQTSSLNAQATFKGVISNNNLTEINTIANGNYGLRTDSGIKGDGYYFYNSAGGNILSNAGISMMTFDSSRNIGIAVSSSIGARLHIRGAGSTSSTYGLLVQNAANSASLSVKDDGNVGIGTSNPTERFEVNTVNGQAFYVNVNSVYSAIGFTANIFRAATNNTMLFGNATLTTANAAVQMATGQQLQTSGNNYSVGILPVYNQVASTAANTDLKIMRTETATGSGAQYLIQAGTLVSPGLFNVTSTGDVGIKTLTPSAALDVSGSGRFTDGLSVTGSVNVTGTITNNGVNIQALSIAYAIALG